MIIFYGIDDAEERKRRETAFRQKYSIKQELGANATILAVGIKFWEKYGNIPPHADHYSHWKNKDGHLVIRLEPYKLGEKSRKELEAWCEKYEFECIYENELLPFHNAEGIEVIILVSKIKYRNERECRKRGWIE
ncbi:MAG: hypothetical protein J6P28_00785 [Treponema sp.]|nr:hypothetical protein [Treponema sp.]MBQ3648674.1 hypothetical protein [Treponema sp.]MBR0125705.1 hypothetical protein [Treponema sp.]HAM77570.1 hypothetical protein [Treponema sp.]